MNKGDRKREAGEGRMGEIIQNTAKAEKINLPEPQKNL